MSSIQITEIPEIEKRGKEVIKELTEENFSNQKSIRF